MIDVKPFTKLLNHKLP